MNLQSLISTDFESVVDFLRPVVVDGTDVPLTLRRAISTREAKSANGKYLASDTVFHFAKSAYSNRPAIGASIVDSGQSWTVIEVVEETLSNRWKCVARLLSLQSPIMVVIKRLVYTKGNTGALIGAYAATVRHVAANVVWGDESTEVSFDNLVSPRKATIQFLENLELNANDRIFLPDNRIMKLLSWAGYDSITQLFTANCEEER